MWPRLASRAGLPAAGCSRTGGVARLIPPRSEMVAPYFGTNTAEHRAAFELSRNFQAFSVSCAAGSEFWAPLG